MSLFTNICCICLKTNCITQLTQNDSKNVPIVSKLETIVPEVEWNTDAKICLQCLEMVDKFIDFKTLCIESNLKQKCAYTNENIIPIKVEVKLDENIKPTSNNLVTLGECSYQQQFEASPSEKTETAFEDEAILSNCEAEYQLESSSSEEETRKRTKQACKCKKCGLTLPNRTKFKQHQKECLRKLKKTPKKRYFCQKKCKKHFTDLAQLEEHKKTCRGLLNTKARICNLEEGVSCEKCTRRFTSEQVLSVHYRECNAILDTSEVWSKCPLCKSVFLNSNALKIHILSDHHVNIDAINMCLGCNAQFDSAQALSAHAHTSKEVATVTPMCATCEETFLSNSELCNHSFEKHSVMWDGEATCEACLEVFSADKYAVAHYKDAHNIDAQLLIRPYLCPLCPARFRQSSFRNHIKTHFNTKKAYDAVKYRCEICLELFSGGNLLMAHCLKDHNPNKKMSVYAYTCRHCPKKATNLGGLFDHTRRHHLRPENMVLNPDQPIISCEVCNTNFDTLNDISHHYKSVHNLEVTSVTSYGCPHCPRRYSMLDTFNEHIATYFKPEGDKQRFVCPTCGADFAYKLTLREHEDAIHKNIKHMCDSCGKTFLKKVYLTIHIKTHHPHLVPDDKLFKCLHCDKSFPSNCELQMHLDRINGVKNYACTYCPKRFTRPTDLNAHETRVHSADQTPKHECPECHRFFKDKGYMKLHMKKEHNIGNLKWVPRHQRPREHACHLCSKDFLQKRDLERHLNAHAGIKPYACQFCSKLYAKKQNCKAHMVKEHQYIA